MQRLVRDPLTHFLALGLLMFVVFRIANPATDASDDPKSIVVDEAALLTFIQYRTKTFESTVAKARLKALPADKLQLLIDDYVREEVLYREALSLGLEANDYIIKRRLIQKLDFISQGFAEAATKLSDEDVTAYYEANKQAYYVAPFVTFTHVFFDKEKHEAEKTHALAQDALQALNAGPVPFSDAPKHGDRFPFHVNYVERTPDFVASHFGADMAKAVFALTPSGDTWHGPYASPYGAHLVMVIKRQDGRTPELDEVKARALQDARREKLKELADAAVQAIIDTYSIRIDYGTGGD